MCWMAAAGGRRTAMAASVILPVYVYQPAGAWYPVFQMYFLTPVTLDRALASDQHRDSSCQQGQFTATINPHSGPGEDVLPKDDQSLPFEHWTGSKGPIPSVVWLPRGVRAICVCSSLNPSGIFLAETATRGIPDSAIHLYAIVSCAHWSGGLNDGFVGRPMSCPQYWAESVATPVPEVGGHRHADHISIWPNHCRVLRFCRGWLQEPGHLDSAVAGCKADNAVKSSPGAVSSAHYFDTPPVEAVAGLTAMSKDAFVVGAINADTVKATEP
ncbi:hypothetical protein BS50DRAFT_583327 [Corynespora cassiicola Philippines]|uniref:Uncharacterized protein n=1 Tax=Corynespora cassiicola Philippines TaxID=1448308 RepID=A0A2T2P1X1_CORCC|nr:hypothetical protein BS50DRAFT_583327 [Corynespora cassiicola Philippines]